MITANEIDGCAAAGRIRCVSESSHRAARGYRWRRICFPSAPGLRHTRFRSEPLDDDPIGPLADEVEAGHGPVALVRPWPPAGRARIR